MLEHTYHHIYALWETASVLSFAVHVGAKYYPLSEFLEKADTLDADSPLIVVFHKVHFEDTATLTVENVERIYESFLHHHCEMGLRRNKPLSLTPALIRRSGLTEADAATVREHLEVMNEMIRHRLQQDFDELKGLDCIKK